MKSAKKAFSDPDPETEWEIWYRDTFDRECPPSVDVSGHGLAGGLKELWARHLFEAVQVDGKKGFSRFYLWWKQKRKGIDIVGDWEEASRLRGWVYGTKHYANKGYVEEGDADLLELIAITHAKLVLSDRSSKEFLAAAKAAQDYPDFETRLCGLAGKPFR